MEKAKSKTISYALPFCTLFVSVNEKLVSILPYHHKHKGFRHIEYDQRLFIFSDCNRP